MLADTWDGTTKTAPDMSTNNGSSETLAIQISSAAQLAWFGDQMRQGKTANGQTYGGKYWKLMDDIDLGGNAGFTGNDWASMIGNTTNAFCGYFDGNNKTISNIQVASITSAKYYGLFPSVQGVSSSNLSKVKSLKIDGVYIKATTSMGATTRIGALTGYVKNGSIVGVAASNVTITYDDGITGANNIGGLIGFVEGATGGQTTITNNSVTNVKISIGGAVAEATYIGGAIGIIGGYTLVDGMNVNGGSISGSTTDKTVTNAKLFFVGGFLGAQNSSGTGAYQPNKFQNIAVTGLTINLAHFVPSGVINNHKFAVGGIAGSVNTPNLDATNNWDGMPENIIFKGGKIYAPYAATSPTVANFNVSAATYSQYTGENITTVDELIKSKRKSWYYSDYELGLSKGLMDNTNAYNAASANGKVKRNFSKATTTDTDDSNLQWLTVDGSTFLKKNRYLDNDRESWTVLWWTRSDNSATYANNDVEQTIYPQSGNTVTTAFADYPYYMYFYQGVANAYYANATDANAIIAGIAANMTQAAEDAPVTLTVSNDKEGERGFDERTISVSATSNETDVTSSYSYQWYLNGKAYTTGSSIKLTPHWKDGQGLTVNALSGSTIVATATYTLVPGVMKTKAGSSENVRSDYTMRGTNDNPYIIDCENALRQLSYLSTAHTAIRWEGIIVPGADPKNQPQGHYNRSYYELGDDITMSKDPFVPISHIGTSNSSSDGTYHQNWIFQGNFDGKGHKISGLNITWGAGQYNANANVYHGLFGAVGNTTASKKWQDASASSTTIKNLIIDNATLKHDANNTSFFYNNGTSGSANNCMVGVLVGIVGSNTTIQNIEIRNSKITDAGSYDYSLAMYGLYVGGAIGSIQYSSVSTTVYNLPANTKIDHVAAQVDITLTHPTYATSPVAAAEVSQFNVGGIIGRYIATNQDQSAVQGTLPQYTFYSGNINAPKAWISPVLASLRYKQNVATNFSNYSKQWEGNNNASEHLSITNAQYYNFRISGQLVSDLYPINVCGNDARSIVPHTDGNDAAATYDTRRYQGVNYGARFIDSDGTTLYFMNQEPADDFYWAWDNGFPHMTDQPQTEAYLDRTDNTLTAQMSEGTGSAYRWQISFDGESWTDIDGATLQQYIANPSSKNKLIVAYVTSGGTEYRTQVESIFSGPNPFDIHIAKTGDSGTGYTFNVVWEDGTVPSGSLTPTYQWYNSDQKTPLVGQTGTSLTLTQSELDATGGYIWCAVKVQESGTTVYKWMLVAGDLNVVYVNGNGYTGSDSNGAYGAGVDTNDGRSPQTPVKTIDKANSLLDGGLWDKNIIVVMGELTTGTDDANAFKSRGTNPATLTGKWDGMDYGGIINIVKGAETGVNPGDGPGKKGFHNYVSADTKFEHLTFRCASNTYDNNFIDCHGHDVWFGKDLVMTNFRNLGKNHGNLNATQNIPELSIILTSTNLSEEDIQTHTDRDKPQTLTIESGHYGRIMGGRFTGAFFTHNGNTCHAILGSSAHPVWAIVNIDIDNNNPNIGTINRHETPTGTVSDNYTCDINCIIAGLTDGTMYGDYEINVHGGKIGYIVGGNQGNPQANGSATFNHPETGKSGTWGEWPNASYFGRTVINIEQNPDLKNITINNLYAGGLGRQLQNTATATVVDMYMYGLTEINIKSGTIEGNIYGGGAGGVIGLNPWDMHVPYATTDANNATNAIMNGVQYGISAGSSLTSVTLHDSDGNGGYTTSQINLGESNTTLNISGGTINGNVYGGGRGFVEDMPGEVTMQGVGSVFGTLNVNVTGGTITGSIYGGSEGDAGYWGKKNNYGQTINHIAEMNGTVNLNITGTEEKYPTIGGNIYGAGQGVASESATKEYLRIATAGNAELGDQYKTNINILIDLPESHPFTGNIYGGGEMGAVDGNTKVVIKHGTIEGDVFGGGKGETGHPNKAKVTGNTNIIVDSEWTETTPEP